MAACHNCSVGGEVGGVVSQHLRCCETVKEKPGERCLAECAEVRRLGYRASMIQCARFATTTVPNMAHAHNPQTRLQPRSSVSPISLGALYGFSFMPPMIANAWRGNKKGGLPRKPASSMLSHVVFRKAHRSNQSATPPPTNAAIKFATCLPVHQKSTRSGVLIIAPSSA